MNDHHDLTPELIRRVHREVAEHDYELPFCLLRATLFSKKRFAELVGVAPDTVRKWEDGYRSPQPTYRKRILELAISVQQEKQRRQDEIRI